MLSGKFLIWKITSRVFIERRNVPNVNSSEMLRMKSKNWWFLMSHSESFNYRQPHLMALDKTLIIIVVVEWQKRMFLIAINKSIQY